MTDTLLNDQLINSVIDLANRQVENFTRIDSHYEKPEKPDIHIKPDELLLDTAAELILNKLIQKEINKFSRSIFS